MSRPEPAQPELLGQLAVDTDSVRPRLKPASRELVRDELQAEEAPESSRGNSWPEDAQWR